MNGHFIALDMHVSVDPSMTSGVFLAAKNFAVVGPSDVTDTNVAGYDFTCMRNRISEQQLRRGQYQGSVALDAAEPSGNVVFAPHWGQDNGWEWQIP